MTMTDRRMPQDAGHGEKLSRKAEAAIAALLVAPTIGAAAERAGVAERTLRTWLRMPAFASAFRRARAELVAAAVADLQRGAAAAVAALVAIVGDAMQPPACRVAAARVILDAGFRGAELVDLSERIAALEARLSGVDADEYATTD